MSGTKVGGVKARDTNKKIYGDDFYRRIGAKGGKLGRTGGFYADRELARRAGAKGGSISRRGKTKKVIVEEKKKGFFDRILHKEIV
jgi:uncharacterized protein